MSEYTLPISHLSNTSAEGDRATCLQTCIATSAAATHGLQKPTRATHAPKPWFDAECWQARRALRLESHLSAVHHHHSSLLASYKALLRRKRRVWERRSSEDLCQLAAKEPSKLWRKYRKREDAPQGISIDAWHEGFSGLLASEVPATPPAAPIMGAGMRQVQGNSSDHLSEAISTSEVASALKRLRRNKAAGVDDIRAEHLLDAQAMLLEPMTNVFTHLLLVEILECLCRGVIHPKF